ncbi:MAG: ATP-binding cassette domain-containing protein [Thermoprotei archaeon]
MAQSTPVVQVRDLTVAFQRGSGFMGSGTKEFVAVEDASLTVYEHETLALIGETGSGKTTLGLATLLLVKPTKGKIFYRGQDLMAKSGPDLRRLRSSLQVVFQDPFSSLDPRMRVGEIVGEPLEGTGLTKREIVEKSRNALSMVGLDPSLSTRYPHEFSGGQRQRIAIARAIVGDPDFIVLDEPTSSLDVSVQAHILNLLLDIQEKTGVSYLFITHNMSVAKYMAHRVAVMHAGRIVETGPVKEVIEAPKHPYTVNLIASVPTVGSKRKPQPTVAREAKPAASRVRCMYSERCQYVMEKCVSNVPSTYSLDHSHSVACFLHSGSSLPENQS